MLEESFLGAAKTLSATSVGAVLIIVLVAFFFTVRALRQDLKDKNAELREERISHQATRDAQITDLRNMGRLAEAIDSMSERFIDVSIGRKRP